MFFKITGANVKYRSYFTYVKYPSSLSSLLKGSFHLFFFFG